MSNNSEMLVNIFMIISDTEELITANKLPEDMPYRVGLEISDRYRLHAYQRILDLFYENGGLI